MHSGKPKFHTILSLLHSERSKLHAILSLLYSKIPKLHTILSLLHSKKAKIACNFSPITLREAKVGYNFGLSECTGIDNSLAHASKMEKCVYPDQLALFSEVNISGYTLVRVFKNISMESHSEFRNTPFILLGEEEQSLCGLGVSEDNLCKQFRPRLSLTKCRAWSRSSLLYTMKVFLKVFFEKVNFGIYQQTPKNMQIYPACKGLNLIKFGPMKLGWNIS